jgi:hypothetical protein
MIAVVLQHQVRLTFEVKEIKTKFVRVIHGSGWASKGKAQGSGKEKPSIANISLLL